MIYAPLYTKVLFAGIELEVFSELEKPCTHNEIAEKLGLHSKNTEYFLDALTSMDLLKKNKGLYLNTGLSSKYLVKSSEFFIGDFIRVYSSISGFDNCNIIKYVKEGPVKEYENKQGLEAHAVFGDYTQMIKKSQKIGRAAEYASIVSSLPEFDGFKKILDLGGGPGLIGIAIIKKRTDLKGVIFDTDETAVSAKEAIKEFNVEDRVEVMSGDYMADSIGNGYDFILASGSLNFALHDLDTIIKKIYNALNPKGVFMCISEGLTNERTKPAEMVIGWLPTLLKGNDFRLEQGVISDAALRNGFKNVYKRTFTTLMGEMDMDIARK